MLPIFWRYLILQFLKVLACVLFGIVGILIMTRLEDLIAVISLGASIKLLTQFLLLQIPYVLQIALPIAALISSLYLFQRWSMTNQLVAQRSCGMSIYHIALPVLIMAFILSLCAFRYVFNMAARCHLQAKFIESMLETLNPALLIESGKAFGRENLKVTMDGSLRDNDAHNVLIVLRNSKRGRFILGCAKKMSMDERSKDELIATDYSFIMPLQSENSSAANIEQGYDNIIIENAHKYFIPFQELMFLAQKKKNWGLSYDLLELPLLLSRKAEIIEMIQENEQEGKNTNSLKKRLWRCYAELTRRSSLACAIFTWTLLGIAFGIQIGRIELKKKLFVPIALVVLFLLSYLGAKVCDDKPKIAIVLYIFPHFTMLIPSILRMRAIQSGIEN